MRRSLALFASLLFVGCEAPSDAVIDPGYHEDIAPLLARSCVSCHTEGGIAPFALDSYEAAMQQASAIKSAVTERRMPPISVDTSGDCNRYTDPRILSDDDIHTIANWVDKGTKEGDPAKEPELDTDPPTLARVDAKVDPDLDYSPNTSLSDDYRCFVVDPGLTEDRILTGYEVRPGQKSEVHHVVLYSIDSDTEDAAAAKLDADEAGPGYTCFGGPGTGGGRTLAVWAPGTGATLYPKDTGIRMLAHRKVIMQVHYNQPTTPDHTTIDLTLEKSVPFEALITGAFDLDLNLEPNQAAVTETQTSVISPAAVPYRVWGVYPHMHTRGRSMHVSMNLGFGDECIADVPRYDFSYQEFFFYQEPIAIPAGAAGTFTISCTYDTRGETHTLHWGEGTGDEMCIAGMYVTL